MSLPPELLAQFSKQLGVPVEDLKVEEPTSAPKVVAPAPKVEVAAKTGRSDWDPSTWDKKDATKELIPETVTDGGWKKDAAGNEYMELPPAGKAPEKTPDQKSTDYEKSIRDEIHSKGLSGAMAEADFNKDAAKLKDLRRIGGEIEKAKTEAEARGEEYSPLSEADKRWATLHGKKLSSNEGWDVPSVVEQGFNLGGKLVSGAYDLGGNLIGGAGDIFQELGDVTGVNKITPEERIQMNKRAAEGGRALDSALEGTQQMIKMPARGLTDLTMNLSDVPEWQQNVALAEDRAKDMAQSRRVAEGQVGFIGKKGTARNLADVAANPDRKDILADQESISNQALVGGFLIPAGGAGELTNLIGKGGKALAASSKVAPVLGKVAAGADRVKGVFTSVAPDVAAATREATKNMPKAAQQLYKRADSVESQALKLEDKATALQEAVAAGTNVEKAGKATKLASQAEELRGEAVILRNTANRIDPNISSLRGSIGKRLATAGLESSGNRAATFLAGRAGWTGARMAAGGLLGKNLGGEYSGMSTGAGILAGLFGRQLATRAASGAMGKVGEISRAVGQRILAPTVSGAQKVIGSGGLTQSAMNLPGAMLQGARNLPKTAIDVTSNVTGRAAAGVIPGAAMMAGISAGDWERMTDEEKNQVIAFGALAGAAGNQLNRAPKRGPINPAEPTRPVSPADVPPPVAPEPVAPVAPVEAPPVAPERPAPGGLGPGQADFIAATKINIDRISKRIADAGADRTPRGEAVRAHLQKQLATAQADLSNAQGSIQLGGEPSPAAPAVLDVNGQPIPMASPDLPPPAGFEPTPAAPEPAVAPVDPAVARAEAIEGHKTQLLDLQAQWDKNTADMAAMPRGSLQQTALKRRNADIKKSQNKLLADLDRAGVDMTAPENLPAVEPAPAAPVANPIAEEASAAMSALGVKVTPDIAARIKATADALGPEATSGDVIAATLRGDDPATLTPKAAKAPEPPADIPPPDEDAGGAAVVVEPTPKPPVAPVVAEPAPVAKKVRKQLEPGEQPAGYDYTPEVDPNRKMLNPADYKDRTVEMERARREVEETISADEQARMAEGVDLLPNDQPYDGPESSVAIPVDPNRKQLNPADYPPKKVTATAPKAELNPAEPAKPITTRKKVEFATEPVNKTVVRKWPKREFGIPVEDVRNLRDALTKSGYTPEEAKAISETASKDQYARYLEDYAYNGRINIEDRPPTGEPTTKSYSAATKAAERKALDPELKPKAAEPVKKLTKEEMRAERDAREAASAEKVSFSDKAKADWKKEFDASEARRIAREAATKAPTGQKTLKRVDDAEGYSQLEVMEDGKPTGTKFSMMEAAGDSAAAAEALGVSKAAVDSAVRDAIQSGAPETPKPKLTKEEKAANKAREADLLRQLDEKLGGKLSGKKPERIREDLPEAKPITEEMNKLRALSESRDNSAEGTTMRNGLNLTPEEHARFAKLEDQIRPKSQAEASADVAKKRASATPPKQQTSAEIIKEHESGNTDLPALYEAIRKEAKSIKTPEDYDAVVEAIDHAAGFETSRSKAKAGEDPDFPLNDVVESMKSINKDELGGTKATEAAPKALEASAESKKLLAKYKDQSDFMDRQDKAAAKRSGKDLAAKFGSGSDQLKNVLKTRNELEASLVKDGFTKIEAEDIRSGDTTVEQVIADRGARDTAPKKTKPEQVPTPGVLPGGNQPDIMAPKAEYDAAVELYTKNNPGEIDMRDLQGLHSFVAEGISPEVAVKRVEAERSAHNAAQGAIDKAVAESGKSLPLKNAAEIYKKAYDEALSTQSSEERLAEIKASIVPGKPIGEIIKLSKEARAIREQLNPGSTKPKVKPKVELTPEQKTAKKEQAMRMIAKYGTKKELNPDMGGATKAPNPTVKAKPVEAPKPPEMVETGLSQATAKEFFDKVPAGRHTNPFGNEYGGIRNKIYKAATGENPPGGNVTGEALMKKLEETFGKGNAVKALKEISDTGKTQFAKSEPTKPKLNLFKDERGSIGFEKSELEKRIEKHFETVSTKGYSPGSTSISRNKPSTIFNLVKDGNYIKKTDKVLHAGAGEKNNPDRAALAELGEVQNYDPQHADESDTTTLRKKDKDVVVSPFVLNVLDKQDRRVPIADMVLSLKKDGKAIVGVRGDKDVSAAKATKANWSQWSDGYLTPKSGGVTFQKGFSSQELVDTLKPHFTKVSVIRKDGQAPVVLAEGPLYDTVDATAKIDLGVGRKPKAKVTKGLDPTKP